jgi:SAM-dependent methyltransferase
VRDVASIVQTVSLLPGSAVLDLGCGAGPHAVAFADAGYRVTALDGSPTLLRIAREVSEQTGLAIEFIQGDMRTFTRPLVFKLVCSLNASFAYFSDDVNSGILKKIHGNLQPRGVCIIDTIGEGLVENDQHQISNIEIGGNIYSCDRDFDARRSVLHEHWTVRSGGTTRNFSAAQRLYQPDELEHLLSSAGFTRISITSAYDKKAPYHANSPRLIAFAEA